MKFYEKLHLKIKMKALKEIFVHFYDKAIILHKMIKMWVNIFFHTVSLKGFQIDSNVDFNLQKS